MLIHLAASHGLVMEKPLSINHDTAAIRDMLALMFQSQRPDEFAQHHTLIFGLATSYAKNPDGSPRTDTAPRNTAPALQIYNDMLALNAVPYNASDHVDAVLASVQGRPMCRR